MKKQFMALSLIIVGGLFASDEARPQMQMENGCYQQCSCTPCCCVPKPKKCIDCECYVPAFYDLQCDWGVFVNAEYLYWYAKENRLPVGATTQTIAVNSSTVSNAFFPSKNVYMGDSWDSGFRVGIGYNSSCDGWDVHLNYTWMRNSKSQSQNFSSIATGAVERDSRTDPVFTTPWILPSVSGISPSIFTSYSAKWNLRYNILDLELGKKYWLSRCFNLRPFVGVRGAWTRQNFTVNLAQEFEDPSLDNFLSENFHNKFWGVGILLGIDPTWYFSSCFALYGELGVSLLWGDFDGKKSELITGVINLPNPSVLSYSFCNDFSGMQSILDTGIGLRYESTFCCDRYRFTLDLGWEHHLWINHVTRPLLDESAATDSAITATFGRIDQLTTDLGLGGLVVRVRFDF